jgi:cytochrome b subunit of formate dehydrogenase
VPLHVQHAVLVATIVVLAATGLPQRLDSLPTSEWLIGTAGGIENVRGVHHAAGAVLLGVGAYHVAFLFVGVLKGRMMMPLRMIPDARDYLDAVAMVFYLAGLRQERPALRAPTYFQKLDYWVVAWGVAVMVITGVIRLFPARMTSILPGDVVAAALELHSDLALLVVVWVVVIHVAHAALSGQPLAEYVAAGPKEDSGGGARHG